MTTAPRGTPASLLRGLGVTSLALALPPLLDPARVLRTAGLGDGPTAQAVVRGVGGRELLHAAGLLAPTLRPAWVWTRVLGDALDLGVLARALGDQPARRRGGESWDRAVVATGLVAAVAAVDVVAALRVRRAARAVRVEATGATTVLQDPQQVYAAWRRLEGLPAFMVHLEQVRETGPTTSRWTATAPFGRTVSWDAEITDDVAGERIAWRSVGRTPVANDGEVRFVPAPGGRGTELHVRLAYAVPGGRLGRAVARYWGEEPHQQLDDDLRRFKQVVETGEVVRSDGAPGGKRARHEFPQHAAQPLSPRERKEVGA